jgi:hypothetical protein
MLLALFFLLSAFLPWSIMRRASARLGLGTPPSPTGTTAGPLLTHPPAESL